MILGTLSFCRPLFLAPMSGITDAPFRKLAREKGCAMAFTEMISAEGLIRKGEKYLDASKDEHPLSVQIFGSCPSTMAEAAKMAQLLGADAIDINMGCPARNVVKTGAGADLMRSPERARKIISEVRRAITVPLTVKIRAGWDGESINAVEIARIAEDCGVEAITIHPRTKVQKFSGRADWSLIRTVKHSVNIPVIGNGDVTSQELAEKMLRETGCDGVMIGRGAIGNPWIFSDGHGCKPTAAFPTLEDRYKTIMRHLSLLVAHYGEEKANGEIRTHLMAYIRGLPFSSVIRRYAFSAEGKEALLEMIASYFAILRRLTVSKAPEPGP